MADDLGVDNASGWAARRSFLPMLAIGLGAVIAMAGSLAAAKVSGLTVEEAVSDPQELTRHRFLGIVSNVGVLAWASAVSVCVFAVFAIDSGEAARRHRRFFLASAAVAMVLLVDDLLLVHEFADDTVAFFVDFERSRRQKDLLEATVFAAYAVMFGFYAFWFRDVLLAARELHYLGAAFAMFLLSSAIDFRALEVVGIDLADVRGVRNVDILLEEGSKLVGIAFYAAFYFGLARQALAHGGVPATSRSATPPAPAARRTSPTT